MNKRQAIILASGGLIHSYFSASVDLNQLLIVA